MLKNQIYITQSSIIVKKNKIEWPRIVGIRTYDDKMLEFLTPNFPRAELFLEEGKVVVISNKNYFYAENASPNDATKISYQEAIKMIEKSAVNINPALRNWIEWRLFLPIIIMEIIILITAFLAGIPIDRLVLMTIFAGIFGSFLGAFWEKKERKKICQR